MFARRYFPRRYFAPRFWPVGGTVAAPPISPGRGEHRLRAVVVPDFQDLGEAQRFLQRLVDELQLQANPIRSVADGGTGFQALEAGKLMGSRTPTEMQQIAVGEGLQLVDGVLSVTTPVVSVDVVIDGADFVIDGANTVVP